MVSSEDFSFPKINNPLPHFAISPSLWRVSSIVYPDSSDEGLENEREAKTVGGGGGGYGRKSFSFLETSPGQELFFHEQKRRVSAGAAEEEKMDMLWEDFNEELQRVSSLDNKGHQTGRQRTQPPPPPPPLQKQQLCCVKNLKTRNRMIYQPKKHNLVFIVKVLKKIFLLHHSARIKKN